MEWEDGVTGFRKAYQANCWGPLGGDGVGVTSIARLTYRTFGDMEEAIRDIAEAGYTGIEFFDGNVIDYEGRLPQLRSLLDQAGLKLVGVYSGGNFIFPDVLGEELARIRRVADAAAALGAEHLVVGGGAKRAAGIRDHDYARLAEGLDKVNDVARERGLAAHFHPHLTTIAETPEQVRRVFAATAIGFCPDTAHLAAAGGDPAAMIREHKDRITYVHLKGWQREPFAFTPIDTGDLDVGAIVRTLVEIGYGGWITVELDSWPDPKEGASRSLAFLRRAESAAAKQ
jgi:inosose dehydratase